MTIAAGWESPEQLRKLFDQSQETIQRLTQQNEALQERVDELKAIYVKLTNSEHVVNDFGEIVGYVATHNILHEIEKLLEQSNENRD